MAARTTHTHGRGTGDGSRRDFKYGVAHITNTIGVFLLDLKLPVKRTLYMVTNNTRSKGVSQGRSGMSRTGWNPHVLKTGRKVCLEPVAGSRGTRGLTLLEDPRNCCVQWQGNDSDSPWLYMGGWRRALGRTRRPGTGRAQAQHSDAPTVSTEWGEAATPRKKHSGNKTPAEVGMPQAP